MTIKYVIHANKSYKYLHSCYLVDNSFLPLHQAHSELPVDSTSIALTYVSVLMWTISGRQLRMEWISQQAIGLQQTDADDDDDDDDE